MKHKMLLQVGSILVILFSGFVLFFRYVFSFDPMVGDVNTYWELSLNRNYLFNSWWVPGYPFIISLMRSISLESLSPAIVMQLISGLGYLVGGLGVYLLFKEKDETLALMCSGFYALFPFTGVVYAVFPIADSLALAALVWCFYFLYNENWLLLGISIAVSLLLQKITWFFIPLIMVFAFYRYKQSRPYVVISVIPILLYLGVGAVVNQDVFWAFRWSAENLLTTRSSLPVLDGLMGPFLTGLSPSKLLRSLVVIVLFFVSAVTLVIAIRQKQYEAMIVPVGLLLMALLVNQYEIWSFVRYSKLISIPIGMILVRMPKLHHQISRPVVLIPALVLCIFSNLAYAYYLTGIFYQS